MKAHRATAVLVVAAAALSVLGASPALASSGSGQRPPSVAAGDYDGPGGIDGPGEVLCNTPAGRMPTLRLGTTNHAYTKLLQAVLGGLRMRPGPVDGIYGPRTRAAVRRFQLANHLTVDGWVGRQTWAALTRAYC
jgi:peptidoglycan hydrolase-like protein with peptidoglycan-binding domain